MTELNIKTLNIGYQKQILHLANTYHSQISNVIKHTPNILINYLIY